MSSHHIVRDEQEPALILASPELLNAEWLGDLLAWSPVVLILEPALAKALSLGIKLDIVLCHSTSEAAVREQVEFQQPIEVMGTTDVTVAKGIEILASRQHKAINISQLIEEPFTPSFHQELDLVYYVGTGRVVRSTRNGFEKWFRKGSRIKVISSVEQLHTSNLSKLEAQEFEVIQDGLIRLAAAEYFWVKEAL
ncbi:MAG: hypothetical protein ACPGJS_20930 [Flammeovirgaceae bacterium]